MTILRSVVDVSADPPAPLASGAEALSPDIDFDDRKAGGAAGAGLPVVD